MRITNFDREELRRHHGADETFLISSFGAKCLTNKTFLVELRAFFGDKTVALTVAEKRDEILDCAERRARGEKGYPSQGVDKSTFLCTKDLRRAVERCGAAKYAPKKGKGKEKKSREGVEEIADVQDAVQSNIPSARKSLSLIHI